MPHSQLERQKQRRESSTCSPETPNPSGLGQHLPVGRADVSSHQVVSFVLLIWQRDSQLMEQLRNTGAPRREKKRKEKANAAEEDGPARRAEQSAKNWSHS